MKVKKSKIAVRRAVEIIKNGKILVFPTDTVYGIGCDPYNENAVQKIFKLKNREQDKSLPVLAMSLDSALKIAKFDRNSKKLAEKFWPGNLTLILPITDMKLKKSMNLEKKIAIRVPKNDWLLEVLKKCEYIVGTSANISGQKSFTDPQQCYKNIECDLFIDGGIIDSKGESTIIEIDNEKIIIHREGSLSRKEILELL
ncbi:MAG: L-threonylcarbamoyladenylate synthase [Nitrosopumilaceae archaeon]|nr:L-threonylcarbamoyladenylate synthase [Nitrosopumilaceae archaeon]